MRTGVLTTLGLGFRVNLGTFLDKLPALLFHSNLQSVRIRHAMSGRVLAHILRNLHRTEMQAAHRDLRSERFALRNGFGDVLLLCAGRKQSANQQINGDCRIAGFHLGHARLAGAKTLCQLTL